VRKSNPTNILLRLKKLTYTNPKCVLHEFDLGDEFTLRVIGDPDNGGYEWVIESPASELKFSDCAYGQSAIALLDGLVAFFGTPKLSTDVELAREGTKNKYNLET
jgi:hypothetical protein